jgi:hypothetical protein
MKCERHSFFTERTHRSAKAFRFGLRGGSCRPDRCASSQSIATITASSSRGPSTREFCRFLSVYCAVCLRGRCAWRRQPIDNRRRQLDGKRTLLTFARCRIIPQFAPLPDLGIDRPKSRRAQLGVAVPQLSQPTPCAIRILRRSGEDGARRHRDASKKHMKYNHTLAAELMVEVLRAKVAFLGASHRCGKRSKDSVTECMEPASRNYRNALRTFSDLVVNGKVQQRSQVGD